MKTKIFLILIICSKINCFSQTANNLAKTNKISSSSGVYKQKGSSEKLELTSDGFYTLYNPESNGHFDIQQCTYSSKGKWRQVSNDILEITSENYYNRQEGFKYELKKENKFPRDSLYIEVKLPADFLYYRKDVVKFTIYFNHNVSKSITTEKSIISLYKDKHLFAKPNEINHIDFSINADVSGTTLYKSRIMFKIFEEDINTEKYNYLTIDLPNFDLCFFEFDPYDQELIFIKSQNELMWKGKSWEKLASISK